MKFSRWSQTAVIGGARTPTDGGVYSKPPECSPEPKLGTEPASGNRIGPINSIREARGGQSEGPVNNRGIWVVESGEWALVRGLVVSNLSGRAPGEWRQSVKYRLYELRVGKVFPSDYP